MSTTPILAVARAVAPNAASNAANTAGPKTVTLIFQQWPGISGDGVDGLNFEINGRQVAAPDGVLPVPLPASGGKTRVKLLDPANPSRAIAEYDVAHRRQLPSLDPANLKGTADLPGLRCRLNLLGYNAGREDIAKLDADLERAVLQFEADHPQLPLEGVLARLPEADVANGTIPGMDLRVPTLQQIDSDLHAAGQAPAKTPAGVKPKPNTGSGVSFGNSPRGKQVFDSERLVLIRIDRADPPAGPGFDRGEFPYVDDRGYVAETRLHDIHGPTVSMIENSTIRLKLIREDLNADAPVYLKSGSVQVTPEVQQIPTGNQVEFKLKSTGISGGHATLMMDFHLGKPPAAGGADGPLIHRMTVTVFETKKVPVAIIATTLGTKITPETVKLTEAEVKQALANANEIWAQAGVRFVLKEFDSLDATAIKLKKPSSKNPDAVLDHNLSQIITEGGKHRDRRINIYVVQNPATLGLNALAMARPTPDTAAHVSAPGGNLPAGVGAVVIQTATLRNSTERGVLAHELGHYLGLGHISDTNKKLSSWDLRRLLFFLTDMNQPSWQPLLNEKERSYHLTVKDLQNVNEDDGTGTPDFIGDGEVWRVRDELDSDRWFTTTPDPDPICTMEEAAAGTPDEAHLTVIRDFRDATLARTALGRAVITVYYCCSPLLARTQRAFPILNTPVRLAVRTLGNCLAPRTTAATCPRQERRHHQVTC